ncbi:MAG: SDR family oxidoreductase, partial [Sandaracinaceae bacterium]|nr:SDR family oxidoreductase [Sandaracinaceae bacterium]
MLNFEGKTVLVTGGTAGIGLACGLGFGRHGARVVLTHRFGSADEDEIRASFKAQGALPPQIVQADAKDDTDTEALLTTLRADHDGIDVLVSNVSAALVVNSFEDYDRRGLLQSIDSTAWPIVGYTRAIRKHFGRYPRYVVGMSSTGPDNFSVGYDFVAASKSVLETLCRYLSYRLSDHDVRVNVVRSRSIRTASFDQTFGRDFVPFAERFCKPEHFLKPEEVAD